MSLLPSHLEKISFSAQSIATLPFPPPQIFTNALLSAPDITSLIRDTEPHERALFSVPPPPPRDSTISQPVYEEPSQKPKRRQTVFAIEGGNITSGASSASERRKPRQHTAVAAVLGAELDGRIRRQEGQRQGELDVEVLLRGAEKLGEVVYVQGLTERCREARERYRRVERSLEWYEERVVEQGMRIERLNREGASARGRTDEEGDTEMGDGEGGEYEEDGEGAVDVDELIRLEEEEIRALEARKRELEERVSGMERDLGGLMR